MKTISTLMIIFICLLPFLLIAQDSTTTASSIQEIINKQQALYDTLTSRLNVAVKSLNDTLVSFNKAYNLTVIPLNADSINYYTAPGDVELPNAHDINDVLLIADRLKMRNNSVNQIVRIISDEKSYLNSAIRSYQAQQDFCKQQLNTAEKRIEQTESWGRKKFIKGMLIGMVCGGLVGIIVE